MSIPKITVIVPAYNIADYLSGCVESLLQQALAELEIILVDDGSTDETGRLCDAFAAREPRIRVIHQENQGPAAARNAGLAAARGEYISFVDGDDRLQPGAFTRLWTIVEDCHPDVVRFGFYGERNGRILEHKIPHYPAGLADENTLRQMRLDAIGSRRTLDYRTPRIHSAWCLLIRRDFLEQTGLRFQTEREILNEDYLFVMQLLWLAESVFVERQAEYRYLVRPGSLSHSYRPHMFKRKQALFAVYRAFLPAGDAEISHRLKNFYIDCMYACAVEEISNLGPKKAIPVLRQILSDPTLTQYLRESNLQPADLKARCICLLMRHRLTGCMYFFYRIFTKFLKK